MKPIPGDEMAAGLLAEAEQAEADKPDLPTLSRLLAAHRGRDDTAAKQLAHALRYIPYDFFSKFRPTGRKIVAEDVLATFWLDYLDCIRRLRTGPEARLIPPEGVESYIRADLKYSKTHYCAEVSRNLFAADSTNCEREKRGDDPYPDLQRVNEPVDARLDGRAVRFLDANDEDEDDATAELLADLHWVVKSAVEEEVIWLLEERKSYTDIAEKLGITRYRVRQIIADLKTRLDCA